MFMLNGRNVSKLSSCLNRLGHVNESILQQLCGKFFVASNFFVGPRLEQRKNLVLHHSLLHSALSDLAFPLKSLKATCKFWMSRIIFAQNSQVRPGKPDQNLTPPPHLNRSDLQTSSFVKSLMVFNNCR